MRAATDALRAQAVAILQANDRGGYSIPADGLYPFQWNWDSAFAAMGYACFDEARAWQEITSLLRGQWPDGMLPHIVFHGDDPRYFPGPAVWDVGHNPPTSGITQPPLLAVAARRIWQGARDRAAADAAVRTLYPKLLAWHRWFHTARDPDGRGLVAILHPWESGMDNSPTWDAPLARVPIDPLPPYERRDTGHVDPAERPQRADYDRYLTLLYRFRALDYAPGALWAESPFRVADVATNAILLRADRDLLALAEALDVEEGRTELAAWITRAEAAFERLWTGAAGGYRCIDQLCGELLQPATSASFLPLFAGVAPVERATLLIDNLRNWAAPVRFLVPSTDPASGAFEPRRYWRGPVWLIVNWMIADGLTGYGASELAARLRQDARALVERSGFREYFDPLTGDGLGGRAFTWTAAVTLFWLTA